MKKLESVSVTRLSNLELGQHIKTVQESIAGTTKAKKAIEDSIYLQYLNELDTKIGAYDKAMMQVKKSDETAKIVQADALRDKAIVTLQRYLSIFEFSLDAELLLKYNSLDTLFSKFKGMRSWNYEEQSNGIVTLIAELKSEKYKESVTALKMGPYITRLQDANENFRNVFTARFQELSNKQVHNVKDLKAELKHTYEKLCNYVLVMAEATDNEEFNKALSMINTVRKYYSDMLAKRNSSSKTSAPIPLLALQAPKQ